LDYFRRVRLVSQVRRSASLQGQRLVVQPEQLGAEHWSVGLLGWPQGLAVHPLAGPPEQVVLLEQPGAGYLPEPQEQRAQAEHPSLPVQQAPQTQVARL
jgi:hypothetical protein